MNIYTQASVQDLFSYKTYHRSIISSQRKFLEKNIISPIIYNSVSNFIWSMESYTSKLTKSKF